ncbi:PTS cellobiose transporter subunit IIC [Lacticaseibacillus chiayiensis]|uniref:PTS cellobiose transporter subunit IIC n=1 Tax=Lacticaseibacillus chiayiensis TaxID=2100821 RepID=UPI00101200B3|nr:PTS cellobiose transporter subunit IIC [Lacticaseibacillus chiayiensis]RXT58222.1 PTS cellobiose transporter subunit IIC [Lacticaseibacillus chiayiensis]
MENNGRFFNFMTKTLLKPMSKVAQYRIVRAVMAAGMASIPFTIVGSMVLVLNVIPLVWPVTAGFWNATFMKFSDLYMVINTATMGILAMYFALAIGYELTRIIQTEDKLKVAPLNGAFLSLFAFFMCLPELVVKGGKIILLNSITSKEKVINGFRMTATIDRLGTSGIFTAIIMAIVAVSLYKFCVKHNWTIKMPDAVPEGVSRSFTALIPTAVIALVVMIINGSLVLLGTDIFKMISIPFSFVTNLTSTWIGVIVIEFLIHALWIVGIHGANIISAFITPILLTNMAANAKVAHIPFAGEFNNSFAIMGGSGATLGLCLFIAFAAHSEQLKVLGRASLAPAFFNINEPLIFGLPIVYNPYLAIPFFLAPMASASLAYAAFYFRLINPIITQAPWPSPLGFGALISTVDIRAVIVAILCAIVAFLIWFPFIKLYDAKLVNDEKQVAAGKDAEA